MEYLNNLLNSNTQSGGVYAVSMHQLNQILQLSSAYFNRFDDNTKQQYIKLFGFTPLSLLKGHSSSKMPQYRERFIFLIYLQFCVLLMMNKTSGMDKNETLKYLGELCENFDISPDNKICKNIRDSLNGSTPPRDDTPPPTDPTGSTPPPSIGPTGSTKDYIKLQKEGEELKKLFNSNEEEKAEEAKRKADEEEAKRKAEKDSDDNRKEYNPGERTDDIPFTDKRINLTAYLDKYLTFLKKEATILNINFEKIEDENSDIKQLEELMSMIDARKKELNINFTRSRYNEIETMSEEDIKKYMKELKDSINKPSSRKQLLSLSEPLKLEKLKSLLPNEEEKEDDKATNVNASSINGNKKASTHHETKNPHSLGGSYNNIDITNTLQDIF